MPVTPATQEAEARECLEPERWSCSELRLCLHSTLGHIVRLYLKKEEEKEEEEEEGEDHQNIHFKKLMSFYIHKAVPKKNNKSN